MNPLQKPQFWVGAFFALLVVLFFMVVVLRGGQLNRTQHALLKFLASFCAACAGGLITGTALFDMHAKLPQGTTIAVSGAAGSALFFFVFIFFPKFEAPPLKDDYSVVVPSGWTFRGAAQRIAQQDNAFVEFVNFTQEELALPLEGRDIRTQTVAEALAVLRHLVQGGTIRSYEVTYEHPTYKLVGHS